MRVIGADEGRQVPLAARLGDVVAESGADIPQVAVGIARFLALVDAEVEGPTDFVEVQMTAGQGQVGPPAILLVLGEGAGQVAVQLVVGIGGAGFQLLPGETGRQPTRQASSRR
jgi:hypothetical protein